MNLRGNVTLIILVIVGVVLALGVGVGVRYITQEIPENISDGVQQSETALSQEGSGSEKIASSPLVPSTPQSSPPVQDDITVNWKIYYNPTYNYEIKMPEAYYSLDLSDDEVQTIRSRDEELPLQFQILATADTATNNSKLIELLKSVQRSEFGGYSSDFEVFKLGNNEFVKNIQWSQSRGTSLRDNIPAYAIRNPITGEIIMFSIMDPLNKFEKEINEMLASFKFKEQSSLSEVESLPDKTLEEARDEQRIDDFNLLREAINLYRNIVMNPILCDDKSRMYTSASGNTAIDGTGWLPIDWTKTPAGSPLSRLPIDPLNDAPRGFIYIYRCDPGSMTYELNAKFESLFDGQDLASVDGGNNPNLYEVGTDPGLDLLP